MKFQIVPTVLAIFLLGLITFAYRFSFISERGRAIGSKIPEKLLHLLAPATFAAIVANNLLSTPADSSEFQRKLVVSTICLGVAYASKSILLTLVVGLGLLNFLTRI